MPAGADDDVIKNFDLHQLAGANQIASDLDVGLRRCGVATWVVVKNHNDRCRDDACRSEHLARMDEQGVHGADRHEVMSFDSAAGVQEQNDEAFAFGIVMRGRRDMGAPVIGGVLRGFADVHALRQGTLAKRDDFVFLRLFSLSRFWRFELEQLGLLHVTLFPVVHLFAQVASGLVTLAAKRGRPFRLER